MDDRELLELAAKAAGICLVWDGIVPKEIIEHWNGDPNNGPETRDWYWNPLEDDGDALRLAVKLRIDLKLWINSKSGKVEAWNHLRSSFGKDGKEYESSHVEPVNEDEYAATRRAIVRAAAEIGRSMS